MIRTTLPPELQDYYNDLDTVVWDMDKVLCLEKKKGFLGLYTRYLYQLPDAYEILGKKEDIYVYHYNVGKPRPTILCAPILGGKMEFKNDKWSGKFPIATINAWIFSVFKQWNAVVVCTNNKAMFTNGDTPANFELALKNVAYNNIQALQFIKTQSVTIPEKIYALGVSLGALTMTGMTGIDDTISACALMLGGGPLTDVIPQSIEGSVYKFFNRLMANLNMTKEELTEEFKKQIKTDPFTLATYIPNGTSFQVIAECDTSVPTKAQKQLWGHLAPSDYFINKMPKYFQWLNWLKGKPGFLDKISQGGNGHYLTILLYPYLIYRTMKFFHNIRH